MKASEEADQALQAFQKADQDMANSRLQIEKVKEMVFFLNFLYHPEGNFATSKLLVESLISFTK